jgi:hypothetical protein
MTDDDQDDLFAPRKPKPQTEAYARWDDPDTSEEAARKISFTDTEQIVLEVFQQYPGRLFTSLCITRLLADRGDNQAWSVSPRLAPLERKGAIERCGKMTVINSNGNPAALTAWRLREAGAAAKVVYLRATNAA